MLCYVLHGPGDLRAEERPIPRPGPGEALVKIASCGICHTDLAAISGDYPFIPPLPAILGHEYGGIVVETGAGVTTAAPGDRVVGMPIATCGLCPMCRRGKPWLCANRRALYGGFAEYVLLPQQCLYKIPPEVTDDQAASAEPFSIAVHAVDLAQFSPGDEVAVVGAGAIGLGLVGMLRFAGAGKIIVSEPAAERRSLALEFGADVALNPLTCDLTAEVKDLTGGYGVDAVFEAVGTPRTVEQSLSLVRRGGTIVIVGVANPQATAAFRPFDVFAGHLTIRGSWGAWWTLPRALELLPKVRPERVLTHRFPLSQALAALELRRKNVGVKALLVP